MSLDPDDNHLALLEVDGKYEIIPRAEAAGIVFPAEEEEDCCCLPCKGRCSQEHQAEESTPSNDQSQEAHEHPENDSTTVPKHMIQIACYYEKRK